MGPVAQATLKSQISEVDRTRQLQLRDLDFINKLQDPPISKNNQAERISMINSLIGIAQGGIDASHKESETAITTYECSRIMAQDTVRMMRKGQAHGEGWEQLSNQWQNLKTFTEHLGRYLAPALQGIKTEIDALSESRREKQLPKGLKELMARIQF